MTAATANPVSDAQRRAIFAAASRIGLSIEDVRALTPSGSISKLTFHQAGDLLKHLNAGTEHAHPRQAPRGPRRPKGVYAIATDAQRRKIESLRISLDWTVEGLNSWLSERTHVDGRPMTRVDSTADANAVIELLKVVLSKTLKAREGSPAEEASSDDETLF